MRNQNKTLFNLFSEMASNRSKMALERLFVAGWCGGSGKGQKISWSAVL
jgi:hypothetical protein